MSPKRLAKSITSYANEIDHCLNKTHDKVSKKSVHDLRIAIRRTRAILWLIRHSRNGLKFKVDDRRLRKMIKALGELRELDVAIEDAKAYQIKCSELKRRRKKIRDDLPETLGKRTYRRVGKHLIADSKKIENSKNLRLDQGVAKLRDEIEKWAEIKIHRKSEFHRLRIVIKRTRYALEALEKPSRRLAVLQDKLGKMHDLEVLQRLLARNAQAAKDLRTVKRELNSLIPETLRHGLIFAQFKGGS